MVERALHEGFFRDFGISRGGGRGDRALADLRALHPLPAGARPQRALRGRGRGAAALLLDLLGGRQASARRSRGRDNPYQAWIDTYADEAFAEGVRKVIAISDRIAAEATPAVRDQMHEAFARAAQLEWMFWDSAWRRETWPV